ncbi:hypothetical protein EON70_00845 [bacterium]|nr:MAG: hypothetical protein EON70_00845 [bacterium]
MHTCKSSNVVKFKQSLRPKTLQSGCFQKLRFWITLFCKPKGTKAKLWFAKLLAKTEFLHANLRVPKQSFGSQTEGFGSTGPILFLDSFVWGLFLYKPTTLFCRNLIIVILFPRSNFIFASKSAQLSELVPLVNYKTKPSEEGRSSCLRYFQKVEQRFVMFLDKLLHTSFA